MTEEGDLCFRTETYECGSEDKTPERILQPPAITIMGRGLLGSVVALHMIYAERYVVERFTAVQRKGGQYAQRATYRYVHREDLGPSLHHASPS